MQRLKELSPIALIAAITVALPVAISSFFSERINEIDRMQALRSRMQAQIHGSIHSQYSARIRETRVLSRCGITAYIVTMLDAGGSEYTLYYDIDNGTPIRQDLLNGCSGRVTESAAEIIGAGEETEIGVARYITNPDCKSCELTIVIADNW